MAIERIFKDTDMFFQTSIIFVDAIILLEQYNKFFFEPTSQKES